MTDYLRDVDFEHPDRGELFDELPLWSAPFGLKMLDRVPLNAGFTYLDVGAGTGFLSVELAQRCGKGVHVIAVDPWRGALDRLRRKIEHLELEGITVIECDAAAVELPPSSIDVIVSNLGVNNFANAHDVLVNVHAAARPDARLHLTTNLVGHMAEFYDVFRRTLAACGREDLLPAFDDHVGHRGTVASVTALLEGAGFAVTTVETDTFRLRYADGSALLRHFFIRLGFLPAWKALVPEDDRDRVFSTLERDLDAVAAGRGELALTIPTAYLEARRA